MKWSKESLIGTLHMRFLLALIIIGIIPFVLVMGLMVSSQSRTLRQQSQRELTQQSTALASKLTFFVDELQRNAKMIASLKAIQSMEPTTQTPMLEDIHTFYDHIDQFAIANMNGQLQASAKPMTLVSIAHVPSFQEAAKGDQSWSIAPALFDPKLMMHMHTPIVDDGGKQVGVLGSPVSLSILNEAVESAENIGTVFVLDETGKVLLHPDPEVMDSQPNFDEFMDRDALENDGTITYAIDNEDRIAGYAKINDLGWLMVTERSESDVLAPIARLLQLGIFGLATALFFGITAAIMITRSLIQPITDLAQVTEEFGKGNYLMPVPDVAYGGSEIATLVHTFDSMRQATIEREEQLRQSEAQTRAIISALPDAIFRLGADGTILDFSAPSQNGLSRDENKMIGVDFFEFTRKADIQGLAQQIYDCFERAHGTQITQVVEAPLKISDRIGIYEIRLSHCGDNEVLALFRNVTNRKQSAALIRKQGLAMESSSDGMAIISRDLELKYVNAAHAKIHGYDSAPDLIGQRLSLLFSNKEFTWLQKKVMPLLFEQGEWRGETIGRKQNGDGFYQELTITLIETGEMVYVSRDITSRKQIEKVLKHERSSLALRVEERTHELREANQELGDALKMKDEFLATMSHELRTPLNAILGMTEALNDEVYGALNQHQKQAITRAENSGRHLLRLINDILSMAKLEAGQLKLEVEDFSVESLCQAAISMVRHSAEKQGVELFKSVDPNVRTIRGDQRRVLQILVNLLSNAVAFTPTGGKIGLEVESDAEAGEVRLTVWDTGIGITEEDQQRLFQPFIQLDSSLSRPHEGSGLGLVLSKRLANLHGGDVTLTSEFGRGSQFAVTLPWGIVSAESIPTALFPNPVTTVNSTPQTTVLLAEDNELNIMTFADYLRYRGYNVIIARTGIETLQVANHTPPDLILMDIQMPIMDGLEATRQLRANPITANIPVIALTGLAMDGDEERCRQAGVDDYLSKPVSLKNLVTTIEKHIQKRIKA